MALHSASYALVGLLLAAAAILYLVRLGAPGWGVATPMYLFDERYTAFTAHRLALADPVAFLVAAHQPWRRAKFSLTKIAGVATTGAQRLTGQPAPRRKP